MDSVIKIIPQIWGVGPSYLYISILVPRSRIVNQTHLQFIETKDSLSLFSESRAKIDTFAFKVGIDQSIDCSNFVTPFRTEVYSPAGLGILLCFYLILFVACAFYYFIGQQPMVSRGVSPFFIIFFCFNQCDIVVCHFRF